MTSATLFSLKANEVKNDLPEFAKAEAFIVSQLDEKLSKYLLYHNREHTFDVLNVSMKIAELERIPEDEMRLLRIAALFHDAGFIHGYKDHERVGCDMVREYLPQWGFTDEQILVICNMIMATKIPQRPITKLDQIIADADLDYLGRDDVYIGAQRLHDEMRLLSLLQDENKWIPLQIEFLKQHHYFTDYSKKNREANKNQYLLALQEQLSR